MKDSIGALRINKVNDKRLTKTVLILALHSLSFCFGNSKDD